MERGKRLRADERVFEREGERNTEVVRADREGLSACNCVIAMTGGRGANRRWSAFEDGKIGSRCVFDSRRI